MTTQKGNHVSQHVLESAAQELADATAHPHFLYEVGSDRACKVLDDIQAAPTSKPDVDEKWVTVPAEVVMPVTTLTVLFTGIVLPFIAGSRSVRSHAGEPDQAARRTTAQ